MLLLPAFQAILRPCPVRATAFTPHDQGRFCGHCQRVVLNFRDSADPVADLAAARAAAPDGRVCGTFRREQVQAATTLTRRLKWFLVALVLVVGQGLSAQEALAQVQKAVKSPKQMVKPSEQRPDIDGIIGLPPTDSVTGEKVYTYVEEMPTFRNERISPAVVLYIQQHIKRPEGSGLLDVEGRLFVSFIVGTDGLVHDAKIVKGLHPLFDAEVLRVVRTLEGFQPGKQNGKPVPVNMTVPITFKLQ